MDHRLPFLCVGGFNSYPGSTLLFCGCSETTALHKAVRSGNEHLVALLLNQSNVKVDTKNKRRATALHVAVEGGHEVMVVSMNHMHAAGMRGRFGIG